MEDGDVIVSDKSALGRKERGKGQHQGRESNDSSMVDTGWLRILEGQETKPGKKSK